MMGVTMDPTSFQRAYTNRPESPTYPQFSRPTTGAVIVGVAAGIARNVRIDVSWVRAALILLCALRGLGLGLYALLWLISRRDAPGTPAVFPDRLRLSWPVGAAFACAAVALALLALNEWQGFHTARLIPVLLGLIGALLVWQAFDEGLGDMVSRVALAVGSVFVASGVIVGVFLLRGAGLLPAILITVAGLAIIIVPALVRMGERLRQERAAKFAAAERARIAAHLHDSVLQTLALIQRQAQEPEVVARLARRQERELRQWLFDPQVKNDSTVFAALSDACGEVEDAFGIHISPVTVGADIPATAATQAAVLAAREAMINAAKHAGVDAVDVFAELSAKNLEIFVRDRGRGFDPDAVTRGDGLRESVFARMKRAGGTAEVTAAPGSGCEVVVSVAVS